MLDTINDLIGSLMASPWADVAVFLITLVDAFFPPVPSETAIIAAAAAGRSLPWVVVLAAAGAFLGDHLSYAIGRVLGVRAARRLLGGERGRAAQAWAERMLQDRGGVIIVAARFIPGGRTATTLTAGTLGFPLLRFTAFDALAVSCWATYAGLIGYFAGALVGGNGLLAVLVGIGVSVVISIVAETTRFLARRRRNRKAPRLGRAGPTWDSHAVSWAHPRREQEGEAVPSGDHEPVAARRHRRRGGVRARPPVVNRRGRTGGRAGALADEPRHRVGLVHRLRGRLHRPGRRRSDAERPLR